jgi:hypothetical protein
VSGKLIEKDGRWLEATAESTAEVARSNAEEIHAKVDRHGFRPLSSEPDDGPDRVHPYG